MLRKYRFLIAGLLCTAIVVFLCLWIPGALLYMGGERAVGKAQQADQVYYADNVSTGDTVSFDLNIRLLMKSGQWKSRSEVILEDEVAEGDLIMPEVDMRIYCGDIFSFLAIDMWDSSYIINAASGFNEQTRSYIRRLAGDEGLEFSENSASGNGTAETRAVDMLDSYKLTLWKLAYDKAKLTLYRYEDQVLNSYYFYAWEYSIVDEALGIDVHFLVDAVTLEVYSVSFHGSLYDELSWIEAMYVYMQNIYGVPDIYFSYFLESGGVYPYTSSGVIMSFLTTYWAGLMEAGHYQNTAEGIEGTTLMTSESGYTLWQGNYWLSRELIFYVADENQMVMEDDRGNVIESCIDVDDGGFEWYLRTIGENDDL